MEIRRFVWTSPCFALHHTMSMRRSLQRERDSETMKVRRESVHMNRTKSTNVPRAQIVAAITLSTRAQTRPAQLAVHGLGDKRARTCITAYFLVSQQLHIGSCYDVCPFC